MQQVMSNQHVIRNGVKATEQKACTGLEDSKSFTTKDQTSAKSETREIYNPTILIIVQPKPKLQIFRQAAVREAAVLLRPKPASKASVEALEKLVFDGEVDYQCVVCMEEMVRGDQATCLPCSHVFHGNCVVKWLKLTHTCPVCRFKLPTE